MASLSAFVVKAAVVGLINKTEKSFKSFNIMLVICDTT